MKCMVCSSKLSRLDIQSEQWSFYHCNNCGLWTSKTADGECPLVTYEGLPDFEVDYSPIYDDLVLSAKHIMAHKFECCDTGKNGKFLDIGCSEGIYVAAANLLGWDSMGIELDSTKVSKAVERGLNVKRINLLDDNKDIPQCDFILLRHVIEHVPDFMAIVRESITLLNKDGILCIEVPNQSSLASIFSRRKLVDGRCLATLYPPTHINAFEQRTIKRLGTESGLTLQKMLTYTTSDEDWFPPLMNQNKGMKTHVQKLIARLGYGGNISAFFKITN